MRGPASIRMMCASPGSMRRKSARGRRGGGSGPRKAFGPVEVDLTAKAAWLDGQSVELTAREWAILEALVLRAGRIVSKSDLEALVCGFDSELASNSLEVHVFKLRSKLGKSFIETVRDRTRDMQALRAELEAVN